MNTKMGDQPVRRGNSQNCHVAKALGFLENQHSLVNTFTGFKV
jgi:hypothetical protein